METRAQLDRVLRQGSAGSRAGRADAETLFCIGSVSKPLASTHCAGAWLVKAKLELAAPVSRYLPSFSPLRVLRLPSRELLAHRGGIYTQRPPP